MSCASYLDLSVVVLDHLPEHAEDSEDVVHAAVGEDGVVPLEVVSAADLPTDFVHLLLQFVDAVGLDFVRESREDL